jgi:hypothetical protein
MGWLEGFEPWATRNTTRLKSEDGAFGPELKGCRSRHLASLTAYRADSLRTSRIQTNLRRILERQDKILWLLELDSNLHTAG